MVSAYTAFPQQGHPGSSAVRDPHRGQRRKRAGNLCPRNAGSHQRIQRLQDAGHAACRCQRRYRRPCAPSGCESRHGRQDRNDKLQCRRLVYGFTPSLVSGCWVGGEDRDIHFDTMLHGQGASMALPIWTKYMVKVLGDKSLGYDENETFQLPEGYDPCKDDVNLEGDTHIEEPIEGLDELFN